jgi:hypothetical protein
MSKRNFKVTYSDGEEVLVKQTSWKNLDDLSVLCFEITQILVEKEGEISDVISPSNTTFWAHAEKICKLLPLVGTDETLDLNRIDDMDQIIDIFVCGIGSINVNTGMLNDMSPSQICRIHSINFFKLVRKAQDNLDQKEKVKTKPTKNSSTK